MALFADIPCCPPPAQTSQAQAHVGRRLGTCTQSSLVARLFTVAAVLAAASPTAAFLVPAALTLSHRPVIAPTRGSAISDDLVKAGLLADNSVPAAAASEPRRSVWRPAVLPALGTEQLAQLRAGDAVFSQQRTGGAGSGLAVFDLEGSPEAVWSLLTDYGRYDQVIGTVRKSTVRAGSTRTCARATFVLSKFLLEVSVLHFFNADRSHLKFHLDPASANRILKEAEGMWFVETAATAPGLKPGHVRVWFRAAVVVSRLVPAFVVDYAQSRALRRATSWLKPAVAAAPLTLAAQMSAGSQIDARGRQATEALNSAMEDEMTSMPVGWVVEEA